MQLVFRSFRGFGWFGLAGLPVVAFLLYCLVGGYDLRYALFALIERFWGMEVIYRVVISQLLFGAYWPSLTGILVSPVTLLWLLIVMFLLPRRWAWWQWALICVWMLTNAPLVFYLARWLWQYVPASRALMTTFGRIPMHTSEAPSLVLLQHIVLCVVLWIMLTTRRPHIPRIARIAPLTLFTLGVLVGSLQYWLNLTRIQATLKTPVEIWVMIGILWHTTCATLGIWAAIAVRHAARTSRHCAHCGYDIHGLSAPTCPECGNTISTDKVVAPPATTTTAAQSGTSSPT
ncbi:MAG: hypothetical protein KGS45_10020 [Planctomycetes bacterium]|nr:hypothetical protein [Planctomycetota bacterium]